MLLLEWIGCDWDDSTALSVDIVISSMPPEKIGLDNFALIDAHSLEFNISGSKLSSIM